MTRAIEKVKPCQDMQDVRRAINAAGRPNEGVRYG